MGEVCVKGLGLQAVLFELWCLLRLMVVCRAQVLFRESWLLKESDQDMRLSRFQMEDFSQTLQLRDSTHKQDCKRDTRLAFGSVPFFRAAPSAPAAAGVAEPGS